MSELFSKLPDMVRRGQLAKLLGFKDPRGVDELVSRGLLPRPLQLGRSMTLFPKAELVEALERTRQLR